jgi:23S rRNA (cytosine1962-C5)-methyltransferase
MSRIVLKKGKDKAIKNRHHWIFSGAVAMLPDFTDGAILQVFNDTGELLGSGYFNRKAKILGRMLSFDATDAKLAITTSIDKAIMWRKTLFSDGQTTGYRLINGEGDCLPGLIVDMYDKVLVLQISTLGMDKLKSFIVEHLKNSLNIESIYEKSNLPSRKEEGLKNEEGLLFGRDVAEVDILENSNKFIVNIKEGQKTGFFLDHREMRNKIQLLSHGKRVLNCFSYTGGFSIYAGHGGATQVDSVDISEKAIEMAKRNVELNNLEKSRFNFYAEDVFQFIRQHDLSYDLIILDPPAFAKKQKDVIQACRGYKDINRVTMQRMPKNSLLLTCSCSYHVDENLFQKVLFQAAIEAGRNVKIIGRHVIATDHPLNIFHPESDYLKSFLLYIE